MPNEDAFESERQGLAHLSVRRLAEAEACFLKALALDPDSFESLLQMGRHMEARQNRPAAEIYFQRAIRVDPTSFEASFSWALALFRFGDIPGAESEARRAITLNSNGPDAHELLGAVLSQKGDVRGAVKQYEHAIAVGPQPSLSALNGLVTNKRITEADRSVVGKMQEMLRQGLPTSQATLVMHVSLGKALDDLGDYGACMHHFEAARQVAAQQGRVRPYDRKEAAQSVDNYKLHFPKELFSRYSHGLDTELPVLIVGMPRTGSTLLEQILSSHPQIAGAGELDWWRTSPISSDPLRVFEKEFAADQAVKYRRALRSVGPTKKRVIDKTLPNYSLLGPLHILFPNARFIHCHRHPIDTCLSIVMNTLLLKEPPAYAFDLDDLVFAYRRYEELMDHWRNVLPPDRLIDIAYEEMISDTEAATRKLLDFIGLEWNDACLHHERNERIVDTPSRWQVRQPIYATSVERWRRYGPWLGPLSELESRNF